MKNIFDIHCHILPNVDDGSDSIEESIAMLKSEYGDGVRHVILTPHYRKRMFETSQGKIIAKYEELKKEAKQKLPDLELYLGAEFHSNMDMISLLQEREQLLMAGSSYVLVEFSEGDEKQKIRERCYTLVSHGYDPIIAHVERYRATMGNLSFINELKQMGAYIQVNADSIIGEDGWKMKRFCKKMMEQRLLDFVGSDAHGAKERRAHMGACAAYMEKKMGKAYTEQILIANPSEIIQGA